MSQYPLSVRKALRAVIDRFSPNRSSRYGATVRGVVIHTTEGSFKGSLSWMLNPRSQVSAHYLVSDIENPDGAYTEVVRLVPESEKAWTARSANPVTINYELAGFARRTRAEWLNQYRQQLQTTAALVASDVLEYGIPLVHGWPGILGHRDLDAAGFPNDHTDPGVMFPWDEFISMIAVALRRGDKPSIVDKPSPSAPCLPPGLKRIPRWAYKMARWHLNGRKGTRPRFAPARLPDWYWPWFNCKFMGGRHR